MYAPPVSLVHHEGMAEKLRILLANEPVAYREALAEFLREVRPHLEVLLVEPEALELGAVGPEGDLVVCSRPTRSVLDRAFAWVELYPNGGPLGTVSIAGSRSEVADMDLRGLLGIVDGAERRLQQQAR